MSKDNREVSENTENINGIVVKTVTTNNSTRFYIVGADGTKVQLAKKKYFNMLEVQATEDIATAKVVREVNGSYRSLSRGEFIQTERTKVEWHEWNLENSDATSKVSKLVDKFDEWYFIESIINDDEDKVFNGGWVYRKGETIGYIDRFIDNKDNLQITLYEDGVMKYWDQPKREYVLGMFKHIDIDVGTDLVSDYYIMPKLTEEQELDIVMGTKSEQDFSSLIHVYRVDIMGIDCLVHYHIDEDRKYFVEALPDASDKTDDNEEEL